MGLLRFIKRAVKFLHLGSKACLFRKLLVVDTVPPGKITIVPPSLRDSLAIFLVSIFVLKASLVSEKSTGSRYPLVSGALRSNEWVKILNSCLIFFDNQHMTRPSNTPKG